LTDNWTGKDESKQEKMEGSFLCAEVGFTPPYLEADPTTSEFTTTTLAL
jgi:hypothetical protein